jgi:hypothetical protein
MALTPNSLARRKSGVQIPSPPPPTSQVRASSASSGRRSLQVAAAVRPQAQVKFQPGRLLATRRPGDQAPGSHDDHAAWSSPAADRRAILARIQPLPVGHAVDLATAHRPRRRPRPSRPCAGPARPAPASSARLQPRADDAPSWTRRATTPTPGHPSRAAACPTATLHDVIPVGHSGRRNPRTPDAGSRDTGHLDTQTPAPDTGHRSLGQAPVGHRTLAPDTSRERGHGDDSTASIRTSFHPAERPHAGTPNRVPALALQPADRPLPGQAAPRRTALLRRFRVERRARRRASSVMACP